jgi:uncharacterized protein YbdZ (MbtH family)
VNHEAQYSNWLASREIPAGWKLAGKNGPKKNLSFQLRFKRQILT